MDNHDGEDPTELSRSGSSQTTESAGPRKTVVKRRRRAAGKYANFFINSEDIPHSRLEGLHVCILCMKSAKRAGEAITRNHGLPRCGNTTNMRLHLIRHHRDSFEIQQLFNLEPPQTKRKKEFMNIENYMSLQTIIQDEDFLKSPEEDPGTNTDTTKNSQTNINKVPVRTPDDFTKDPLEGHSPSATKMIKGTGQCAPDMAESAAVNIPKWPNRHVAFIQSVAPTLDALDEDEILEFQSGVIDLIKTIKLRRRKMENSLKRPYRHIGNTNSPYQNKEDRSTSRSNLESLKSNSSADREDNFMNSMSDSSCTSDDL